MIQTQPVGFCDSEDQSPSCRVIEAVAAEEGTSPIEIETPLYESIDPDALDMLFERRTTNTSIEFAFCGYRVTVRDDDPIELTPLND